MSKIEDINIQKKKPAFKVNDIFLNYLKKYNRVEDISIDYDDLMRYVGSVDVLDTQDNHTLWQRVYYSDSETNELNENLKKIYNILLSDGSNTNTSDLNVDAVDFCTFGNSNPFRIKIRNILNDNFTYFYIKKIDSSRIYGLELEHITSPYNLNFILNKNTLIEEHISGIPGDDFFSKKLIKKLYFLKKNIFLIINIPNIVNFIFKTPINYQIIYSSINWIIYITINNIKSFLFIIIKNISNNHVCIIFK